MKRFNLLPAQRHRRRPPHLRAILTIVTCAVLGAAIAAASLQQRSELHAHERELAALTSELGQAQGRVRALQRYANLQSRTSAMTRSADEILARRLPWSAFLEQLGVVIPDSVWLVSLSCAAPTTATLDRPQSTPADNPTAGVVLVGRGFSHREVARFMTRLQQLPLLADIRLLDSQQNSLETTSIPQSLAFCVEASLRLAAAADSSTPEPAE